MRTDYVIGGKLSSITQHRHTAHHDTVAKWPDGLEWMELLRGEGTECKFSVLIQGTPMLHMLASPSRALAVLTLSVRSPIHTQDGRSELKLHFSEIAFFTVHKAETQISAAACAAFEGKFSFLRKGADSMCPNINTHTTNDTRYTDIII